MADNRNFFIKALRFVMWLAGDEIDFEPDVPPVVWGRRRKVYGVWTFRVNGVVIQGENIMGVLNVGQAVDAQVVFKGKDGGDAKYQEGSVVWSSSDPAVASVQADPADERKAKIKGLSAVDSAGESNPAAVIECRADGDPNEAVRELISTAAISVTDPDAGEAFFSEIQLGEPYDDVEAPAGGGGGENPDNLPHPDNTLPGDLESEEGGGGSGDESEGSSSSR
jgi:hypothetical protein